jgi:hypothetical protein
MKNKDITFISSFTENKKDCFLAICFMATLGISANLVAEEESESVAEHRGTGPYANVSGSASQTLGQSATSDLAAARPLSANVQVLSTTGAGVYTPTPGMQYVIVEALAGGGGSGGGAATTLFASAGGGAGSYSKKALTAAQVGATLAYVVGTGGTAGASGGGAGVAGVATTFGSTLVTTNGGAGSATASAAALTGGAGGAIGTGGIKAGNNGGNTIASMTLGMSGAAGANTIYGQGGYAVPMATGANAGNPGQGFGAGAGGGTAGVGTPAVFAGGAGAQGVIILTEYILS